MGQPKKFLSASQELIKSISARKESHDKWIIYFGCSHCFVRRNSILVREKGKDRKKGNINYCGKYDMIAKHRWTKKKLGDPGPHKGGLPQSADLGTAGWNELKPSLSKSAYHSSRPLLRACMRGGSNSNTSLTFLPGSFKYATWMQSPRSLSNFVLFRGVNQNQYQLNCEKNIILGAFL